MRKRLQSDYNQKRWHLTLKSTVTGYIASSY